MKKGTLVFQAATVLFFAFKSMATSGCQSPITDSLSRSNQKINLVSSNWYQLTNAAEGLEKMTDGDLSQPMNNGKGSIIEYFEAYYPLAAGEYLRLDSIRFFALGKRGQHPMRLSTIDDNWKRTEIAVFAGSEKTGWTGPDPKNPKAFALPQPTAPIRYLVLTMGDAPPAEIEFFGVYQRKPNAIVAPPVKKVYLKDLMGVNAYEWNFLKESDHGQLDAFRMGNLRYFSGIRHYLDWERIEEKKGSYTFNPAHNGSWNYDQLYELLFLMHKDLLVCIKTIPKWLQETYPLDQRNNENAPLAFGMDAGDPRSYLDQSKLAFQFAARYGNNAKIPDSLLKVDTRSRWTADPPNVPKKGLGWVRFMECENERDKWWKGRQAYQTGREYAANLSAFYDGHMGKLGKNTGVKQADSTIQVVMGGVATPTADYLRGMIDWCKEFRGLKPNGQVNVCWDIVNFHLYATEERLNRGVSPEWETRFSAENCAADFLQTAARELNNMPVWVTETGYDVHPGSPNKAIALGPSNVLATQADWVLRTALLYARLGIEKVFFYQLYDDNAVSGQKYATAGLMEGETTPRPAAIYLGQTKRYFGDFGFKASLQKKPVVDAYEDKNKNPMWVVYLPTEKGQTQTHVLEVGAGQKAYAYKPTTQGDLMEVKEIPVVNGKCQLVISETPLFVTKRLVTPAPML